MLVRSIFFEVYLRSLCQVSLSVEHLSQCVIDLSSKRTQMYTWEKKQNHITLFESGRETWEVLEWVWTYKEILERDSWETLAGSNEYTFRNTFFFGRQWIHNQWAIIQSSRNRDHIQLLSGEQNNKSMDLFFQTCGNHIRKKSVWHSSYPWKR